MKRDGENGYYITPLVDILEKHAKREKRVAELTGQKFEAQLMIVADQTTPYRLLTEVIYSCGQAGYANYRLLVLKPGRLTLAALASRRAAPSRGPSPSDATEPQAALARPHFRGEARLRSLGSADRAACFVVRAAASWTGTLAHGHRPG